MSTIVLDASVLVDVFTERASYDAVLAAVVGSEVIAPAHLPAETMSAIGRLHRAGTLSAEEAAAALDKLESFPIEYEPVSTLVLAAWALRDNLRLTDALYVALARRRNATLLSVDERLVAAAPDVVRLPETPIDDG